MKKIALSTFRNRISSRLDSAEEIQLLIIENGQIKKREKIKIVPKSTLDKIHQIVELSPDVLICGGLTQLCDNKLKNSNITVIPWTKGNADEVLKRYLEEHLYEPITINNE